MEILLNTPHLLELSENEDFIDLFCMSKILHCVKSVCLIYSYQLSYDLNY